MKKSTPPGPRRSATGKPPVVNQPDAEGTKDASDKRASAVRGIIKRNKESGEQT
jgi:hypothetical protein